MQSEGVLIADFHDNEHKSKLVKIRITVHPTPQLYLPGGSSNLRLHVLAGGLTLKSPLLWVIMSRVRDPSPI